MTPTAPDIWAIREDQYPADGARVEKLTHLLHYAVMAPSGHNSQPWLFKVHPNWLEVYADRTRALPVIDPDDRELTISVGAALYNLRLAMRRFGLNPAVELTPDPDMPDLLAAVTVAGEATPSQDELEQFAVIARRRTNRHRFEDRPVDTDLVGRLVAAAEAEGAWFIPVDSPRLDVASLIAEADQQQMADKMFRRELAQWIHPQRRASRDGMPSFTLGPGDPSAIGAPFVLRTFEHADVQASLDYRIAAGSPLLAVLGTAGDTTEDWLKAGQALARLLLVAAAGGASASYLNQPIEVLPLRPRLAALLGREDFPQLILRMGYGPDAPPSARRPLAQVLL